MGIFWTMPINRTLRFAGSNGHQAVLFDLNGFEFRIFKAIPKARMILNRQILNDF